MKFLKLALISAAMLLSIPSMAAADETYPHSWVYSDPNSIGSDAYSPKTYIQTGDEPASVYYEYGSTDQYGLQSPAESVAANSERFYSPSLKADIAGGTVFFRLVMITATQIKYGPAGAMGTRGPVPVNLEPPRIEGEPYPGSTLTCNPGTWNTSTRSAMTKWPGTGDHRSELPPSNDLTLWTIKLTDEDIGKSIRCSVRVTIVHIGSAEAFSEPVKILPRPGSGSVVATASPTCQLPPLRGLLLAAARAKLSRHGCLLPRSIRHAYSGSVKRGRVISATLDGGSVRLLVSKGRKRPKR